MGWKDKLVTEFGNINWACIAQPFPFPLFWNLDIVSRGSLLCTIITIILPTLPWLRVSWINSGAWDQEIRLSLEISLILQYHLNDWRYSGPRCFTRFSYFPVGLELERRKWKCYILGLPRNLSMANNSVNFLEYIPNDIISAYNFILRQQG